MEIRQLEYLVAIAQQGGFRAASRELNVGPSNLSAQMRLLERELGVRLFERVGRRAILTEAGRRFCDNAEKALADLNRARQEMLDIARLETGELVVGTMPGRGFLWLPSFLDAFIHAYPQLRFRLVERSATGLIKMLEAGEVNIAWFSIPANGDPLPNGVSFQAVNTGDLAVVVSRDHPLAERESVRITELVDETFILPSLEETPRLMFEKVFRKLGAEPNVRFEADDPLTLIRLAERGLGLGVTYARHGRSQPESVATLPFVDPPLRTTFGVGWSRDRGAHPRPLRTFVDFFQKWWQENRSDDANLSSAKPDRAPWPATSR